MRIWQVPFGELDGQRVLGQHNEIHALYGLIIRDNRPWAGLTQEDEDYIWFVHEMTVVEASYRGWKMAHNHQTPIARQEGWEVGAHRGWLDTHADLHEIRDMELRRREDRWHLWLRWGGEYKGRVPFEKLDEEAQAHYAMHKALFDAQGGCIHDGPVEKHAGGVELCLLCKRAWRANSGPWKAKW